MRVLHVVPSYLPAVRYGGTAIATHGLCRALVRAGHPVDVFTTVVDGREDIPLATGVRQERDGVGVHYFPVPALRRWYYSPALARSVRERVRDYDLVHVHALFLHPVSAAASAAFGAGVPYVISPRGMLEQALFRRRSALLKHGWLALLGRRALQRARAVHVTSPREAREVSRFGLRLDAVLEVPNGVERVVDDAGRREPGLLLFLGRLSWKKRVDRLLHALAAVPDARLVVAGPDDEQRVPGLAALARRCQVADRVQFVGAVDGAHKDELLARAAVFVLPSESENFANAALEAMAAGCPVVLSRHVGLADAVLEGGAGLVCDDDTGSLAVCLRQMLQSPQAASRMGEAAQQVVRERYLWDTVARDMTSAYHSVLDREIRAGAC